MKRTLISLALTFAMLFTIGSHVIAQETSQTAELEGIAATQTGELTSLELEVESSLMGELNPYRDGDVPAGLSAVDAITPPVSALVLCMLELGLDYDQSDDSFYWSGLYYMLSLYGQMDSRAQFTDDTLILPPEAVADYAAALFAEFDGLPALPESMAERIQLIDGEYHLARGDAGQLTCEITSTVSQTDGTVLAYGDMVSAVDGSAVCTFTVKLQPNDSMFGYAICDAVVK